MAKYTLFVNKQTNERSARNNQTGEVVRESQNPVYYAEIRRKALAAARRRAMTEAMDSIGMTRVRGNLGGTYWE